MLEVEEIIQNNNFFHYFQPIYNIQKWDILGYEGLFRTEEKINPQEFFDQAKKGKKLYEIDSRSIHKAFLTFLDAGFFMKADNLFVNVHPSTLTNEMFSTFINRIIKENYTKSQQIILEISESEQIKNFHNVKTRVQELKKEGFLIALDDVGKNYSSLKTIIELEPDYVKLDSYFVENLHESKNKMYLIEHLLNFCSNLNAQLIAEGVEDQRTLATLKSLGVEYAQGYVLGRPSILK